jgi:hypothetical protein
MFKTLIAFRFVELLRARSLALIAVALFGLGEAPMVHASDIVGGVKGDYFVFCEDVRLALSALNTHTGGPGYVPAVDIDGNSVIDVRDISVIKAALPPGSNCNDPGLRLIANAGLARDAKVGVAIVLDGSDSDYVNLKSSYLSR